MRVIAIAEALRRQGHLTQSEGENVMSGSIKLKVQGTVA
jgi:hypothetical protein